MTSPIPHNWQVPEAFRERMGSQAGRQRCMTHAGHLLVILHAIPDPETPEKREARLFWRGPDGTWQASAGGAPGIAPLRAHVEAFVEATRQVRPMDGKLPGALFGPMINHAQVERVEQHVGDAVARGGRLLAGGQRLEGAGHEGGSFYAPTVLADVPDDALVMCEETFGPVAPVVGYASTEEVIRRANATRFGLAAYVYSQDVGQALQLAERLEFGGVGINVNDVCELQAPFGGWKHSGVGRELGSEGLLAYMEAKHIRMRLPPLK